MEEDMAVTIYMCGHGAWDPKDGFIQLPPKVTMTFIVDVAKVLYTNDMFEVCGGTYTGQPARTIGEDGTATRTCPNMTWTSDDPAKITECDKRLKNNPASGQAMVLFPNHITKYLDKTRSIKLSSFFADYWPSAGAMLGGQPVNLIWACCGYVQLKSSAQGAALGVNAAQTAGQYDHVDYTGQNPILTGKVTKM
jgi:hypothetical protein